MAINIVVSDLVGFKVEGAINDEAGVPQSFNFKLTCERLDADEITTKLKDESDKSFTDFIVSVLRGWKDVRDADNKPLEFSEEAYRALCKIPGIAALCFRTYLKEVGAKEKN